jgi:hypothetical protein
MVRGSVLLMDRRSEADGAAPGGVGRRAALLLPLLLAACGGGEDESGESFPPLRYNYLPPIEMKVAGIVIEQRFVPAGVPPDVSNLDPVQPVDALKAMANDRLIPLGTDNKAVFEIQNASLVRQNGVIAGTFQVTLSIVDDSGNRLGFATAQVTSQHTGSEDHIRKTLYDLTKSMMANMNVEFEYQVRKSLQPWLTSATAPDQPVQQTPLDQSGNPEAPQGSAPPVASDQVAPDQGGIGQSGVGQRVPPSDVAPGAPAPIQLTPPAPGAGASAPQVSPAFPSGYLVPPSRSR